MQAWPILEPETEFVDGIHVHAICLHLQAVTEGRIPNLIINIPPGHAKSLLVAVFWPAWLARRTPTAGAAEGQRRFEATQEFFSVEPTPAVPNFDGFGETVI